MADLSAIYGLIRRAIAAAVFAALGVIATPDSSHAQAAAAGKKIIFLAGPKEHGAPGRHEYEKDLRELAWQIENSTNLKGLTTEVIVGKPPRDISVYEDAAVIVIDGNGAWLKRETGMLFQQDQDTDGRKYDAETTEFLARLDELVKSKHIGVVVYHYTMWVDNWAGRNLFLDWLGGIWIPYASHNPVDTWAVKPIGGKHPVLRGVKPWSMREEMYSRYFLFDNPKRTELLSGTPAKPANGAAGPISWAYERPDGGRSIVWGGADFHDNMHLIPDYRRFLVNGIVWAAQVEVPAGGVSAPPPPEM
jgi:type 1 glutamine amidotransferase